VIELRYLVHGGKNVLQYRAQQTLMEIPIGWSDWQDVPVVPAEGDEK